MRPIKHVVIAGGGTAGWITAALLNKVLGKVINITLIESSSIGTVGVGEATIPPIIQLNNALGINEQEFINETNATIKLGIEFENWKTPTHRYMHAFGSIGKNFPFCDFYNFWLKGHITGCEDELWDFSLNYQAAKQHKFAPLNTIPNTQLPGLSYAYHFDATLYAEYLKKLTISRGVKHIDAKISDVTQCLTTGNVETLILDDNKQVNGDLFIDCTGLRALLIEKTLNTGFVDWSHYLPCDSAIAVQTKSNDELKPYTQSIAHSAGWQWQIPLQSRIGNGLVYCSRYLSDEDAKTLLLNNLPADPITEPRFIKFKTGRRIKQWHKNVVAVGLSSGFLEPLESTSIHLIQSAVTRLIKLFPHYGISDTLVNEFNKQSVTEIEHIRDFIILHYKLTEREDSAFWRQCMQMDIPDSLNHKLNLFKQTGKVMREDDELFAEIAWQQVMIGQGLMPDDYSTIVDSLTNEQLSDLFISLKTLINSTVEKLPTHKEFLASIKRAS
ncbi:tryptophan 7-halogenase [Pseudoalteromonas sp. SG45-5]|uniref:tryptophan halogenase family protein n=1 Tax=unclassified Pseudoalteromonas TaxID=194690 RepID=UPI0015FB794D|nr:MULTISPECIES: tryptophan halogenase family protein [unclassified Pseudoalteromonas]MBB1386758.1 tryptophan 7-halogenase [Pseudoalteromonas sp. SG45-5]MBB1394812.1 tryptophan 7-halogenase [Pseudoalteromonas sp. SG44-4]MBB1446701.1 tryptophan 7-halogenase [Pseudoalteromonas sp. SG41-6]